MAFAVEFSHAASMGDQRLVVGLTGRAAQPPTEANESCACSVSSVWQRFKAVTHGPDGITKAAI